MKTYKEFLSERKKFSVSDDPKKIKNEDDLLDFMDFLESALKTGDKNNVDTVKAKIKATEKELKRRGFE